MSESRKVMRIARQQKDGRQPAIVLDRASPATRLFVLTAIADGSIYWEQENNYQPRLRPEAAFLRYVVLVTSLMLGVVSAFVISFSKIL
jgi:hypothetical protein